MSVERYPGLELPEGHPARADGRSDAWRCDECGGFFYPIGSPAECPYCTGDDEEDDR